MKTKDILSRDTRILSQDQRESYFELGYVGLPGVIDEAGDKTAFSIQRTHRKKSFSQGF